MKHKSTLIFSTAIILATLILSYTYLNRYPKDHTGYVEVKGMGQTDFDSDLIVWEGKFSKENRNLKDAYSQINNDKNIVQNFLVSKGLTDKEIIFGPVRTNEIIKTLYSNEGKVIGDEFLGYELSQQVMIESKDVDKVENIPRLITEVLNNGVRFYSSEPRYYFSGLSNLKIDLISKATEDARIRAEKIALNSGADLGDLISADMGVLQIVGQNSGESYSWGGTFNTSSRKKTASITMDLEYKIEN